MEAENQFLSAFQQLLKTKPESLKDSERTELEGLITSLPNDPRQLAEAIADWSAAHSKINHALKQILEGSLTSENSREIAGNYPSPETQAEFEKNLRENLLNSLRQISSSVNPQPETANG